MMMKYIQDILNLLKSRIAGMKANPDKWINQEVTVIELEADVTQLEAQSAKNDAAESNLQKERNASRIMVESLIQKQKQVDNLAYGIHAKEPAKLADYGLSLRKPGTVKGVPAKVMITSIVDDVDGEGFIITWLRAADAVHYEIEKGFADNTSDVVLSPPFSFLKSTFKLSLHDDNVVKGRRYFYRIRAVNASGTGEWSEPVNKVQ